MDITDAVGELLVNKHNIMTQTIKWFESKTIWFNIIVTVLGIAASLQSIATFDKYAQVLGLVTVIGNVILRVWFTNTVIATPITN